MNRNREEKLLRALNDVGDDLVTMAGQRRYAAGPWRRWGALAASLALVIGLTAVALPYLPMGCGSSESDAVYEEAFDYTAGEAEAPLAVQQTETGATQNKSQSEEQCIQECETAVENEPCECPDLYAEGFADEIDPETPDLVWMTNYLVLPLERWQVGTFDSPEELTEDALERLALAVEERDNNRGYLPSQNTREFVTSNLVPVLEDYSYEPADDALPLDGALQDLPVLEPVELITGETMTLLVRRTEADGEQTLLAYEFRQNGDGWYYISVTEQ